MKAFHFTKNGKLRDGRPVPAIGEELRHEGKISMCVSGLHASKNLIHAMRYAPGLELHVVDVEEIVDEQRDKLVCRSRTIEKSVKLDLKQVVRFALESTCLKSWLCGCYSEKLIEALSLSDLGDYRAAADAAAYAAAYVAHAATYAAAYAAHAAADAAAYAAAVTDCLEQRAQALFCVA